MLWPHGICAATCCTNAESGHAAAKARMYSRFRAERPVIAGKAFNRSRERRSTTFAPQPCCYWRSRISVPMVQYRRTSSLFAATAARV